MKAERPSLPWIYLLADSCAISKGVAGGLKLIRFVPGPAFRFILALIALENFSRTSKNRLWPNILEMDANLCSENIDIPELPTIWCHYDGKGKPKQDLPW